MFGILINDPVWGIVALVSNKATSTHIQPTLIHIFVLYCNTSHS